MTSILRWFIRTPLGEHWAILFVRLMAGGVFLWEGFGKFIFPSLGVGRFTLIGLPTPELFSTGIALLEIVGGTLFIVGLFTRPVAVLFIAR